MMEIPHYFQGLPLHTAEAKLMLITPTGLEEKDVAFVLMSDLAEDDPVGLGHAMQSIGMALLNAHFEGPNEG
jgi:hypothetical protein